MLAPLSERPSTAEPSPRAVQAVHRGWLPSCGVFEMLAPFACGPAGERVEGRLRSSGGLHVEDGRRARRGRGEGSWFRPGPLREEAACRPGKTHGSHSSSENREKREDCLFEVDDTDRSAPPLGRGPQDPDPPGRRSPATGAGSGAVGGCVVLYSRAVHEAGAPRRHPPSARSLPAALAMIDGSRG